MFEYLIGDALSKGADTLIAGAAAQSNYCRQLAAAAARSGLKAILILRTVRGDVDFEVQGNLLLDVLAGAEVSVFAVDPKRQQELLDEAAARVRAAGGVPYIPQRQEYLGAIAYVHCAVEINSQLEQLNKNPTAVYVAAAGETQAGLVLGLKAIGNKVPIVGINPGVTWWDVRSHVVELANRAAERLGLSVTIDVPEVTTVDAFYGDAYGIPTQEGIAALKLVAETEGVFLDPVYTSKAMAALIAARSSGRLESNSVVLFVHTGGIPALFHYRDALKVPKKLVPREQHVLDLGPESGRRGLGGP